MEYQNYDDYMRSILGYSVPSVPNFSQRNLNTNIYSSSNMFQSNSNLERMYPDTYRAVYPIIVSTSNMVTLPITEEMLDRMVDDIYDKVETNGIININVEFRNRDDSKLREKTNISKSDVNSSKLDDSSRQNFNPGRPPRPPMPPRPPIRPNPPRPRNPVFRDLIKILLLRELLGRNQF